MNLPSQLAQRLNHQLAEAYPDFLQALQLPAPVSTRLNPKKTFQHSYSEKIDWCENGFYLAARPVFTLDPLLHAGAYYVQEASSMLLEQVVIQNDLDKNACLALDLCAAPGGKSTHLLSLLQPQSLLISNEVIKTRANILSENIIKWGYPNSIITQNDPQHFAQLQGLFDLILIDAPCSGEGLIRKNPEALNEWSENNLKLCSSRQQRIVADVWPALKEGGILIYSTCTYNPEENMQQLLWMLQEYAFRSLPITLDERWGVEHLQEKNLHAYQCWPHKVKGEGFFMSVLQKTSSSNTTNLKSGKTKNNTVHKSIVQEVSNWIQQPEAFHFHEQNEMVFAFPKQHDALIQLLQAELYIMHMGLPLGEVKKNKIIPQHALALSTQYNPTAFPSFELNKEQALAYLHRDSIDLSAAAKGFVRLTHQQLGLGWANNLGNRSNNMYPVNWRIRLNVS